MMINNNVLSKAYTEVLEIIKYFPKEEYNKIPLEKIQYFQKNMDNNYNFIINPKIDLRKQNISKEANAIIIKLYYDYFATEDEKNKIYERLKLNQNKLEEKKREKYNPDDIFKNKNLNFNKEKLDIIKIQEDKISIFSKIINKIKSLFR